MQHLTEKKVKVCPNGFHNNKDSECTCGEKIKNTKWATTKETITECNGLFLPESKTETINYLASMSKEDDILKAGAKHFADNFTNVINKMSKE